MNKKILFYHIPKTAGSSIGVFFETIFGYDNVVNLNKEEGENKDIIADNEDKIVIRGHFNNMSEVKDIFDKRYSIVFLRDPIARFISQYYHERKRDNGKGELISDLAHKLSFSEYTNYIKKSTSFNSVSHINNRQVCALCDGNRVLPRIKLWQAKKNLRKFNFIGLTEKSNESLELLIKSAHIETEERLPKENVGKYNPKEPIDDKTKKVIGKLNRLDIKLYKYALKLYEIEKKKILG